MVFTAKVADTPELPLSFAEQSDVPVHCPNQPVKTEPVAAVAVSTGTGAPEYSYVHVLPQSSSASSLVTVPDPEPLFTILMLKVGTEETDIFADAVNAKEGLTLRS